MNELILGNTILSDLAITLLHFVWQGAFIALSLKVSLMLTSTNNAQMRYLLSTLAMLACIVFPIITFQALRHINLEAIPDILLNLSPFTVEQSSGLVSNSPWYQFSFINATTLSILSVVWLLAVVFLTSRLILELLGVEKLRNAKKTVPPLASLSQRFAELVKQVGIANTPKLLISTATSVPMAIGWLKPVVLIPCSMLSGLTPAQLDMLILHELAHIKRHDYAVNLIQTLVETLLFFHPAVHWISKQMRNEREYCSDDIAVHHCGNSLAYARTLADTASHCLQHRHHTIPTMALAASGGDLKLRVVRLVQPPSCTAKSNSATWFSVASIAVVLSTLLFVFGNSLISVPTSISEGQKAQNIQPVNTLTAAITAVISPSLSNALINKKFINDSVIDTTSIPLPISDDIAENKQENSQQVLVEASVIVEETIVTPDVIVTENTVATISNETVSTIPSQVNNQEKAQVTSDINIIANEIQLANLQAYKHQQEVTQVFDLYLNHEELVESYKRLPHSTTKPLLHAKLIESREPKYPLSAQRRGLEGEVEIEFVIDKNGLVKDLQFKSVDSTTTFKKAIRSAMKKWRFEPAKVGGKPVESTMTKIFSFNLNA